MALFPMRPHGLSPADSFLCMFLGSLDIRGPRCTDSYPHYYHSHSYPFYDPSHRIPLLVMEVSRASASGIDPSPQPPSLHPQVFCRLLRNLSLSGTAVRTPVPHPSFRPCGKVNG